MVEDVAEDGADRVVLFGNPGGECVGEELLKGGEVNIVVGVGVIAI